MFMDWLIRNRQVKYKMYIETQEAMNYLSLKCNLHEGKDFFTFGLFTDVDQSQ